MAAEKHTPGPLVARPINHSVRPWAVIDPNGVVGDEIIAGHLTEADARLYAAAPDLLSCCKAALGAFERNDAIDWSDLQKAIEKAEGRP